MSFISSLISSKGAYQTGVQQQAAYKYNAAINEANAVAERRKSNEEERISRKKTAALMASQRALYAKAGVDLSSGSPLLVLSEAAQESEREAQMIKWSGDVAVAKEKNMATLNRYYGKAAMKSGKTQAWGYGVQAAGQAGSSAMSAYGGGG